MIPADMLSVIEYAHPHMAHRIVQTWGDELCVSYMRGLLMPESYNEQTALQEPQASALMGLMELHDKLHPRQGDIWEAQ